MAVNYKLIRSVIKDYFKIDKNPKKGLMTLEWVMLGYMAITIITMLFTYTKLVNPEAMLWGRLRVLVMTIALWAVYRMITLPHHQDGAHHRPDGFACLVVSRHLRNQPHVSQPRPYLCRLGAGSFGCQPALLFAKALPWAVVSELMSMGYFMYYPMIALVSFYYFFCRYYEAERASIRHARQFLYLLSHLHLCTGSGPDLLL